MIKSRFEFPDGYSLLEIESNNIRPSMIYEDK